MILSTLEILHLPLSAALFHLLLAPGEGSEA
jgi:hypothetical protein